MIANVVALLVVGIVVSIVWDYRAVLRKFFLG